MGGSKSSQTQQTSNTSIQQSFTDQSYNDYSDNSRVDIWTDNSDNSRTDIFTDNSDNSRVDIWTDNSNNSRNDGMLSGSTVGGNVQILQTADGAFDLAAMMGGFMRDVSETAIKNATEQTYLATSAASASASAALASNEKVTKDSLAAMERTAADSVFGITKASLNAVDGMLVSSKYAVDGALDATTIAAKAMADGGLQLARSTEQATQSAIEASNKAMERNAALIQTTALGGQDLLIDMVKKVLIAVAVAGGVGLSLYAVKGAK